MSLCPHHRLELIKNPARAIQACRQLIEEGTRAHRSQDYQHSCRQFQAGVEISQLMLANKPCPTLINMRVIAGHNLSASYVANGENDSAEQTLCCMHEEIACICQNKLLERKLRLEALSQLQTTLFSLSSQLGSMGKSEQLHQLIADTEHLAESTAQQLFH